MGIRQSWVGKAAFVGVTVALMLAGRVPAALAVDIEGLALGGKGLITSPGVVFPQSVSTPVVLKLKLRVTTLGFALRLCVGSFSDFQAGNCSIGVNGVAAAQRSGTGEHLDGFALLDNVQLFGNLLYVVNVTSGAQTATVGFVVSVE